MALPAEAAQGRADGISGKVTTAQGAAIRVTVLAVRATYERWLARRRLAHVATSPRRKER